MKSMTMRSMIAVAALAVAAASASAQTYEANIPMPFRANGAVLPAGAYRFQVVSHNNGQPVLSVRNLATAHSVLLPSYPGSDVPKAWQEESKPVLGFDCLAGNCTLRRIWNGSDRSTYQFPRLKVSRADAERVASITVALTRGD